MFKSYFLFSVTAAICSCAPQSAIVQGVQRQDSTKSYDDALAEEGLVDCNGAILALDENHDACPPNGGVPTAVEVSEEGGSVPDVNASAGTPSAEVPQPPVAQNQDVLTPNPNEPVANPNDPAVSPVGQVAVDPVPTPVPTPALDPAANGDPNVVVFRIKAGTGDGPWNDAASTIRAKVGNIIRFVNDDTVRHRLHTGGEPCRHGPNFEPGEIFDCVATKPVDSMGTSTYDHNSGKNSAPVFIKVDP